MTLSADMIKQLTTVHEMWSKGATQKEVAAAVGKSLSTVRGNLSNYGYKFARGGKIEPIHPTGIAFEDFIRDLAA